MPPAYLRVGEPDQAYKSVVGIPHGCTGKVRYPTFRQCDAVVKKSRRMVATYRCHVCGYWHATSGSDK